VPENDVSITISAKDDTGTGFGSAEGRAKAFEAAITRSYASQARAAKLLTDANKVLDEGNVRTADSTERSGAAAAGAASQFSMLGGGGGLGAAIAAGVVLSPVIATLGVGLGGLGLAALSAGRRSQQLKQDLAPLKAEFAAFSRSLQPQVLGVFSAGLRLAGQLLHDIQPVAKATGTALAGVLGAIGREFQSGTWQNFFGFMARTAAPDLKLVGQLFVSILDALPPLIMDLQPLATGLLHVADAAARVTGVLAHAPLLLTNTTGALATLNRQAGQTSHSTDTMGAALYQAGLRTQGAGSIISLFHTTVAGAGQALKFLAGEAGAPARPIAVTGRAASIAAGMLSTMAGAVKALMTAQQNALNAQLGYANGLIASSNDAVALEKALDHSRNMIGLHTAAQKASFSAATTYIAQLAATAQSAIASGKGVQGAIKAIAGGLGTLKSASSGTAAYWQAVQTLVGWLDKLRAQADITKHINIVTTYTGAASAFAYRRGPGMAAGGIAGAAAGGLRSGMTMVGERGRELVQLPAGSRVFNNAQTEGMLAQRASGGVTNVTVNLYAPVGSSPREIGRTLAEYLKEYQRAGGKVVWQG